MFFLLVFTVIITSTSVLVIIAVYLDTTDVEKVYAYILQAVAGGVLGKRFALKMLRYHCRISIISVLGFVMLLRYSISVFKKYCTSTVYAYILPSPNTSMVYCYLWLGVTLLSQIRTIFTFLKNLFVSQSARIRQLSKQASSEPTVLQSLGFMHKVTDFLP